MGDGRIYVGNLPADVQERDVEDLFYKYGKIRDIELKNNRGTIPFAFVRFEDPRDAEDAVHGRNGYGFGDSNLFKGLSVLGETAFIRVHGERSSSWGRSRSRSRSRSRGRYSPYQSRGSPRYQSPPPRRRSLSRHSPPPARQRSSPPPRHYR
ncbi:UNVERIFIED_CONTAM: hypothetical protein FKN15_054044 [Acipenser sinensis]